MLDRARHVLVGPVKAPEDSRAWLGPEGADAALVRAACLALGRNSRDALAAVERMAAGEELVVHRGDGGHAQGVALTAPYGHPLVERGPLGGLRLGAAEAVGGLARHVERDRQLLGGRVLLGGGVVGHEVRDGGADGAAADPVLAGDRRDGAPLQVTESGPDMTDPRAGGRGINWCPGRPGEPAGASGGRSQATMLWLLPWYLYRSVTRRVNGELTTPVER